MIHEAFIKAEIAKRYYKKRGIELENEPARKRFLLDKNIDKAVLKQVIDEVYKQQKALLK
jgi:hypothetical protein